MTWLTALGAAVFGALSVIAAVLFTRRGRGPGSVAAAAIPLGGAHESSGAWTVDRACRELAAACAGQPRPIPAVGAVVLGPETIALRLATPDEAPPTGWTTVEHGRSWTMALERVPSRLADSTLPAPFPTLVSLGVTDAGRVLLNLAQAGGVVSLEGDATRARALARAWARRLTTSPWSAEIPVIRIGFDPDPADGFTGVDVSSLTQAAATLEGPVGGVLVFAGAPQGRDLDQVARLLDGTEARWAVVAVEAVDARWRITVDPDGAVETSFLDGPAHLRA